MRLGMFMAWGTPNVDTRMTEQRGSMTFLACLSIENKVLKHARRYYLCWII